MLKTTYKPSAAAAAAKAPLPPGWTEHKAPTGHTYYYHAETQESTYKRPGLPLPPAAPAVVASPYGNIPNLSDPNVANAYLRQLNQGQSRGGHGHGGRGGGRGGAHDGRPRPQPIDKPRRREAIPGCEPWILVYTKYSRRFVYNPEKNTSYWRIPEKLMPGILELDKARIQRKAGGDDEKEEEAGQDKPEKETAEPSGPAEGVKQAQFDEGDSSEYEEVEVTDDEDGEGDDDAHPSKRRRTDDSGAPIDDDEEDQGPVEFTEADIAAQLAAMGDEYGLEPGDYDDGNVDEWPEGAAGVAFSEEDAKLLFTDLLEDLGVSPYSPWEKLLEDGKITEDPRYTALSTTKARKDCHDQWSREKIAAIKEQRAKQEKKDPRIPYMAFLQEKATPKLYWPEFKRKYKKEAPMKDMNLADKDREKAYREHISRLKQPQATRKTALTTLLKAQPLHILHNKSLASDLPTQVLIDPSYIALEPEVRDPLIEAYLQTLAGPPEDVEGAQADEEAKSKREKREKALEERNRVVDEQRWKRERDLKGAKARLREGEREVEVAMRAGNRGLKSQLVDDEG
nr:pre-mRNA-splicing factor [Verruciconidia persicina]